MTTLQEAAQLDLDKIAGTLADISSVPGSKLSSPEQKKEIIYKKLLEGVDECSEEFSKGLFFMSEGVDLKDKEQVKQELDKLVEKLKSKEGQALLTPSQNGQSLRSVLGIPDFLIETLYKPASAFFNA